MGRLLVLGRGSTSGRSTGSGAGCRMRWIRGIRRTSTMYIRSLREGFSCSSSFECDNCWGARGYGRRTSEIVDDDCCNDFSYVRVSSNNWRNRMRTSSRRRCALEGANPASGWLRFSQMLENILERTHSNKIQYDRPRLNRTFSCV